jgi:hypothetical protein
LDNPDLAPLEEIDPVLEPIWDQDYLSTHDPLVLVFPSEEVIFEAMTRLNRPWDDLHHKYYFLPKMRRVEVGEFTMIVNGDATCLINPLAIHIIYFKGNMETIDETIPIDISRNPGVIENIFIEVDCSFKEIQIYTKLFKVFCDVFS